jgi:hypothetical protein
MYIRHFEIMPRRQEAKPLPGYKCCQIACLNGTMPPEKFWLAVSFFIAVGLSGILFGLAAALDENALYYAAGPCLGYAVFIIMLDQSPCLNKMFCNNSQTKSNN